jgi:hypothetical protein
MNAMNAGASNPSWGPTGRVWLRALLAIDLLVALSCRPWATPGR